MHSLDDDSRPAIHAAGLNHFYGNGSERMHVLKDICLDVQRGEFVALAGPSGCGKSTLLTLVGGLKSVQDGVLDVLGYRLNGCSPVLLNRLRSKIGMVFQSHHLMEFLTAMQNVQVATEAVIDCSYRAREQRCLELLASVGLRDKANQYPSMLSGGQKQRVAFARALACAPELIVADEPTAALDGKTGREVVMTLRSVAKERSISIVMATHDPRVMEMADRVIAIEDGRLVPHSSAGFR